MKISLSIPLSESYRNKCSLTQILSKNPDMIMFEKLQGINPMGLSAFLADCEKKILHKHENSTNNLKMKHKEYKIFTLCDFLPLVWLVFSQLKYSQSLDNGN